MSRACELHTSLHIPSSAQLNVEPQVPCPKVLAARAIFTLTALATNRTNKDASSPSSPLSPSAKLNSHPPHLPRTSPQTSHAFPQPRSTLAKRVDVVLYNVNRASPSPSSSSPRLIGLTLAPPVPVERSILVHPLHPHHPFQFIPSRSILIPRPPSPHAHGVHSTVV